MSDWVKQSFNDAVYLFLFSFCNTLGTLYEYYCIKEFYRFITNETIKSSADEKVYRFNEVSRHLYNSESSKYEGVCRFEKYRLLTLEELIIAREEQMYTSVY